MKYGQAILLLSLFFTSYSAFAQKKTIDPSVYNDWKKIGDLLLSPDGKYSAYTIKPHRGDGFLFIINNETGKKDSIARGVEPQFSGTSNFLAFKITPTFDTLRTCELNKTPKDKWPKDSLGIWLCANDSLVKVAKVKEFKVSIESDWIAYLSTSNELPKGYLSKKELKKEAKLTKKKGPIKTDGKVLGVWNPAVKTTYYRNVTQFDISKNGAYVSYTDQQKFKKDSVRLNVLSTGDKTTWKTPNRFTELNQVNFGTSNKYLVGLYSTDTTEEKRWSGFVLDCTSDNWTIFADTAQRFETNRTLSNHAKPKISPDETYIQFGVWNAPKKDFKDTLTEAEKVKIDVWHWQDDRIQPQQLSELKRDENKYNAYIYTLSDKKTVQIGRDSLDLQFPSKATNRFALAINDEKHEAENWRVPLPANYYRVDLSNGNVLPLRDETVFDASLSPSGRYFVYYNEINRHWYSMDVGVEIETCLTCSVKTNWWEDLNGSPTIPTPIGIVGWTGNESGVLVQSEHDIWYYDYKSTRLISVTQRLREREGDTNYRYTLSNFVADSSLYYPDNLCLTQFNQQTKAMNVYRVSGSFPNLSYTLIAGSNHNYVGLKRAKNAQTILFQRHSNADYPDAFISMKAGAPEKQISLTNPQQSEYNWSTVELINWTSYDGLELQGLVYKPENFDVNKEYPLLVYFYELYSDELHNHYAPKPTASIIFPTEYASAGYVVFIPDIRYKPGHPANGAYDCIMSGTDAVLRKYSNIDPKRLGLQGQSWGGYQTAQMITMTDRYAAAMAGAAVSNMFSAYGGIRWGSGLSRQFQYEHQQSRIGKTIWEAPELYIENSPLFQLPKVKTPLLIMHNDLDGAVPWYQGIELYMGLRRLQKPVWLLNYNGEDHNLMRNANRIDLSIRMRQYFDYYLLGAPMPVWLKEGIPAVDKGEKFGLETVD
ncbi:MAG: S9 family peptidase [Flavobacteriia bacterium]|nr:S9 family peptidase [Flavobacteriia bacterium]